jgi:precorrin-2 dehydrogenase/sirohydrochlorin ferrochelatase
MKFFPIFLKISGRSCLVVGGGDVGTRKVNSLLASGAYVTVVSKDISDELKELVDRGKVKYLEGAFSPDHLSGIFLCIVAIDNKSVTDKIAGICRKSGVLVNVADDPEMCDFYFPSVVSRGDLTIAISSGGTSPAMAKKLREEMEVEYGPEYESVFKVMGFLRDRLMQLGQNSTKLKNLMGKLASIPMAEIIRQGEIEKLKTEVEAVIEGEADITDIGLDKFRWSDLKRG